MVAFCSNAVGLRRCAGSKRDEDESVPCDCIDCILDARHPVNAIIGSTSNILIEPESPFNRGFPPRTLFISTRHAPLPPDFAIETRYGANPGDGRAHRRLWQRPVASVARRNRRAPPPGLHAGRFAMNLRAHENQSTARQGRRCAHLGRLVFDDAALVPARARTWLERSIRPMGDKQSFDTADECETIRMRLMKLSSDSPRDRRLRRFGLCFHRRPAAQGKINRCANNLE